MFPDKKKAYVKTNPVGFTTDHPESEIIIGHNII